MRSHKQSPNILSVISALLLGTSLSATPATLSEITASLESLQNELKILSIPPAREVSTSDQALVSIFQRAQSAYQQKEFLTTIRLLNEALNRSNQIGGTEFLEANYLLGRSYEELDASSKAMRAYLRYLGGYSTQSIEKSKQLLEVIKRTIALSESMAMKDKKSFQQTIINIVKINQVHQINKNIKLQAAIALYHMQDYTLAQDWLSEIKESKDPKILMEAEYYSAMCLLGIGKEKEALEQLEAITRKSDESAMIVKDLAALNIARIYAHQNKIILAQDWYKKIKNIGIHQRHALYELTTMLLKNQDYSNAFKFAKIYIEKYPSTQNSRQIREWLPYLQFQSGEYKEAAFQIENREKHLTILKNTLNETRSEKFSLDLKTLEEIRKKTENLAIYSPTVSDIIQKFKNLDAIEEKIRNHESEIKGIYHTLGQVSDGILRPDIKNFSHRTQDYLKNLYDVANTILSFETDAYQKQLSKATVASLQHSQNRRKKLMLHNFSSGSKEWNRWQWTLEKSLKIAHIGEEIAKMMAQINAQALSCNASMQSEMCDELNEIRTSYAQNFSRYENLSQKMNSYLSVYSRKSTMLGAQKKMHLMVTHEILDAQSMLDKHRDTYTGPSMRHEQIKIQQSWQKWEQLAGAILKEINDKENEQIQWFGKNTETISAIESDYNRLMQNAKITKIRIVKDAARQLPNILDQYQYEIEQQQARAHKWLADLEWQRISQRNKMSDDENENRKKEEADYEAKIRELQIERSINE